MKKLIFLFLLTLSVNCFGQFITSTVDTANWSFKANSNDGRYTMIQNKAEYLGKGAGQIVTPLQFDVSAVDTSKWLFIPIGSDGTYRLVENKETFMGMDSGTVRAQVVSGITSIGTGTTEEGAVTLNTIAGVITTNSLTGQEMSEVTLNNSHITRSSVIIVSLFGSDIDIRYGLGYGITTQSTGQAVIKLSKLGGTFADELKIHFLIIN